MRWQYVDKDAIGAGLAVTGNYVIATNNGGWIYALNKISGKKTWEYKTKGKIYSTPVIKGNSVIVASTDSNIYCIQINTGKLIWKYHTNKPIVASPEIVGNTLFIGSSEGYFRALNTRNGKLIWDYAGVNDFIMSKPLFYGGNIYFGGWGNEFYALDAGTGKLNWKWVDSSRNRIFLPAGSQPIGTNGKIFIITADQFLTVFDAATGKMLHQKSEPSLRIRESMTLSKDSLQLYVKSTDGKLLAVATNEPDISINWSTKLKTTYDVSSAPAIESKALIYVPSDAGVVSAVDKAKKELAWKYKVSHSLITGIVSTSERNIVVSTVEGKIVCLQF